MEKNKDNTVGSVLISVITFPITMLLLAIVMLLGAFADFIDRLYKVIFQKFFETEAQREQRYQETREKIIKAHMRR